MILQAISAAYGAAAAWRRRWYAQQPARRRRLSRPVVSVGNLTVGGSGKTPVVECIARALADAGERPAILTRGYGRPRASDGVTVVSDGTRVVASFADAGDEPLMLARALRGVPVLVGADRYLSGRFAEEQFGATVHILDDGFQHVQLARDVDLLLVDEADLGERVLPAGRLREPLRAASGADAIVVRAGADGAAIARHLGVSTVFNVTRTLPASASAAHERAFAFAGIARPERFFRDLEVAGWPVCGTLAFRDHHVFTKADVARIRSQAAACQAAVLLTTAKDAVRLGDADFGGLALTVVPLAVTIEPADAFRDWLLAKVRQAR